MEERFGQAGNRRNQKPLQPRSLARSKFDAQKEEWQQLLRENIKGRGGTNGGGPDGTKLIEDTSHGQQEQEQQEQLAASS